MVPAVIGLPVVTNPKQKKATGMSSAYWNWLLKPTFLVGRENSGERLGMQHQQSLITSPGLPAVLCPVHNWQQTPDTLTVTWWLRNFLQ